MTKEEKKQEAIRRMNSLGMFKETIRQFEKDGYISRSDPPFGAFYWVDEEELSAIRKFEDEYNALVYVVIRSYTTIGTMDSYLYVSDFSEEWLQDREVLKDGTPLAYVINYDMPDCSEFGYISIALTSADGLVRKF